MSEDPTPRALDSGVEGVRAETDDELGELDIYEALINPNLRKGSKGGSGGGAGGGMMPMMGMGGGGSGAAGGGSAGAAAGVGTAGGLSGMPSGASGMGLGGLGSAGRMPTIGGLGGLGGLRGAGMGGGIGGFGTSAAGASDIAIDLDGDGRPDYFGGGIDTDGDGIADWWPENGTPPPDGFVWDPSKNVGPDWEELERIRRERDERLERERQQLEETERRRAEEEAERERQRQTERRQQEERELRERERREAERREQEEREREERERQLEEREREQRERDKERETWGPGDPDRPKLDWPDEGGHEYTPPKFDLPDRTLSDYPGGSFPGGNYPGGSGIGGTGVAVNPLDLEGVAKSWDDLSAEMAELKTLADEQKLSDAGFGFLPVRRGNYENVQTGIAGLSDTASTEFTSIATNLGQQARGYREQEEEFAAQAQNMTGEDA